MNAHAKVFDDAQTECLFKMAVKVDATMVVKASSQEEAALIAQSMAGNLVYLRSGPELEVFSGALEDKRRPTASLSGFGFLRVSSDGELALIAKGEPGND